MGGLLFGDSYANHVCQVAAWLASLPGVELIKGTVTDSKALGRLLQGVAAQRCNGPTKTRGNPWENHGRMMGLWEKSHMEISS